MSDKDDLISRQLAIEALDELFKKAVHPSNMSAYEYDSAYAQGEIDAYVTAIDTLKTLAPVQFARMPTVNPEPHWIPCSERLPDKGNVVLWCNEYGSVFASEITFKNEDYWCIGNRHRSELIAWMPLPEPYRGGEKDDR